MRHNRDFGIMEEYVNYQNPVNNKSSAAMM